jgi:DNA-binding response OmpR family regulator
MRILVIEDDRKAAELLATGLREDGLVVDVASPGEAGDEMASVNTYAAIVLDWLLPDKNGVGVCRDLRRRAGAVVPRSAITEHVWVSELDMSPNLLEVHLSRLRRKTDHGRRSPLIHTIRSRGYMIGLDGP